MVRRTHKKKIKEKTGQSLFSFVIKKLKHRRSVIEDIHCLPIHPSMSTPRRSARIASMTTPTKSSAPLVCPPAPKKEAVRADAQSLLAALDTVAPEADYAIRHTILFLSACADPDELTAEAISWLTRVCWAIEDCHEYKKRQLTVNCDQNVMDSIPLVLQYCRTLTTETRKLHERFRQYERIPRSLVKFACSFGADIKEELRFI